MGIVLNMKLNMKRLEKCINSCSIYYNLTDIEKLNAILVSKELIVTLIT